MIPELIVPDLEDCKLKPYVSYATKEILQKIKSLKQVKIKVKKIKLQNEEALKWSLKGPTMNGMSDL